MITCSELFFAIDIFSGSGQFSAGSVATSGRARSEGLQLLGSICSHAVLSDGRSQFAARDLRRFSDCNEQAVCTEELPKSGCHKKATLPLQASSSKCGYFDH